MIQETESWAGASFAAWRYMRSLVIVGSGHDVGGELDQRIFGTGWSDGRQTRWRAWSVGEVLSETHGWAILGLAVRAGALDGETGEMIGQS